MRLTSKLGLLALVVVVGACVFAPSASAAFTCTGGRATCVVTLTATVRDPSRSGSTGTTFVTAGGLATLSCDDSTISSDTVGGRDVARTGASNITTTGASVDFTTNCRINIDTGCTVTPAATRGDSRWTIALSSPSGAGPAYGVLLSIGDVRITLSTCRVAGVNGILTIRGQSLGTTCARYTSTTGILTVTRCTVAYTSTAPNLPGGNASFTGSYHATVDGAGTSPSVS